ncbi:MAG: DUF488 family protein [Thermoleophilia bacterium]
MTGGRLFEDPGPPPAPAVADDGFTVLTVGHGARSLDELLGCLREAGAATLVDVRRFPSSRRFPWFDQVPLAAALGAAGIAYRHAVDLGGRLSGEAGAGSFACLGSPQLASYAARMGTPAWQDALAAALAERAPCLMCAEADWRHCHRRLIADLLAARGYRVLHVLAPGRVEPHRLSAEAEARGGLLHLCGHPVA